MISWFLLAVKHYDLGVIENSMDIVQSLNGLLSVIAHTGVT